MITEDWNLLVLSVPFWYRFFRKKFPGAFYGSGTDIKCMVLFQFRFLKKKFLSKRRLELHFWGLNFLHFTKLL